MTRMIAVCLALAASLCLAHADRAAVDAELARVSDLIEGFSVVELPATGEVVLSPASSVTIEDLRGVALDDDPPVSGEPAAEWDPRMADDCEADARPYAPEGIAPFRLREFNCEFCYGGWHTWSMNQFAAEHGFGIVSTYNSTPADWAQLPEGTRFMRWGGFIDWPTWMPEHGIAEGRYDLLANTDVTSQLVGEEKMRLLEGYDSIMIDLEHGRLSPEKLREQEWYPGGSEADRAAFEKRYYAGWAQTYVAPLEALRRNGWRDISVYGWQPFGRTWFGLDKVQLDPETDFAWNAFGKTIYDAVDILNPSVYCFYSSPQNVAYTLANIDLNMALVNSADDSKPMRPYYWTLLHGGGAGDRWWKNQPMPDEDARAMTTLCFFTGCDGMVSWNWSGTGSHQIVKLEEGKYVMLRDEFAVGELALKRYDVIKLIAIAEDGTVTFQCADPEAGPAGIADGAPSYTIARDELLPHLRAKAEPVAAQIEGLALVKPFERILRQGEPVVDVSAQEQYRDTLPIVRRVTIEGYDIVATYDPMVIHGGEPRSIVLEDFAGHAGLTLTLPADDQVRIFALREQ